MKEVCDNCDREYDYAKASPVLNLYVEDPDCNNIVTKCPHCGTMERIFAVADSFLHIMNQLGCGLSLHPRADDKLKAAAKRTWADKRGNPPETIQDVLPDLPAAWRRQLYDDLRNWKGVME